MIRIYGHIADQPSSGCALANWDYLAWNRLIISTECRTLPNQITGVLRWSGQYTIGLHDYACSIRQ